MTDSDRCSFWLLIILVPRAPRFFFFAPETSSPGRKEKIEFFHWLIKNECTTRINEWMSGIFGHPVTAETRASVSPTTWPKETEDLGTRMVVDTQTNAQISQFPPFQRKRLRGWRQNNSGFVFIVIFLVEFICLSHVGVWPGYFCYAGKNV